MEIFDSAEPLMRRGHSSCALVGSWLLHANNASTRVQSKAGMDGFTDTAYNAAADAFLECLETAVETSESDNVEDMTLSDGVLTIETTNSGSFVINKQAPNKQLWLSSPITGPHHYDMVVGSGGVVEWVGDRDGHLLRTKLEGELSRCLERTITLKALS